MKRKRFTEEQIAFALRQAEEGTPVKEVCRKLQISDQTSYRWKRKFMGMGVAGAHPGDPRGQGELGLSTDLSRKVFV